MANAEPVLQLRNVRRTFDAPGDAAEVLRGVDLVVPGGEALAMVGPSGSGKSTLLHIIGTLDQPTAGEVIFEGRNVRELDERALAHLRNRKIGFVFQLHHLLPQLTVLENVLIPTLVGGRTSDVRERALRLLERVGLGPRVSYRPGQLSGGEQQRVAVVRALINQPALLLADEPTGSLDHATAQTLAGLLFELNREEGVTLIMVTHALDLTARMDRVLELRDGVLHGR